MSRFAFFFAALLAAVAGATPQPGLAAERAEHLVVGKVSNNPKKMHPAAAALGEYLVETANGAGLKTSSVVLTLTSSEMAERLRKGEVDIVSDTLFSALIYERDAGAEIALREWKKGVPTYKSIIVARADSGIDSLEKLAGKRMAFEDESSTTAYHAPMAVMLRRGLKLARIDANAAPAAGTVGYFFAGSETNLLVRVHRGLADAGAINNLEWNDPEVTPEVIRRDLRVIYESPPITRGVLVMRRGLAKPVREALLNALTAMHEDAGGRQVLQGLSKVTRYDRFEGEAKKVLDRSRDLLAPALKSRVATR